MALNDFSQAANAAPRNVMIQAQHIKPKLTPKVDKQPVKIVVPEMNIEAIPTAMRRMGWTVSAALMERWFASPEWTMPVEWKKRGENFAGGRATQLGAPYVDDKIVTMAWAMRFARCKQACRDLIARSGNEKTASELKDQLKKAGWRGEPQFPLGSLTLSSREVDETLAVNALTFGGFRDPLDDVYGALGIASLKMGFIGEVVQDLQTKRNLFYVSHAAIYLKDFYDFNGDQFLGTWTESGVLSMPEMVTHSLLNVVGYQWNGEDIGVVHNGDFDRFRKRRGRGGDFVVFSDIHWIELGQWIELEADN